MSDPGGPTRTQGPEISARIGPQHMKAKMAEVDQRGLKLHGLAARYHRAGRVPPQEIQDGINRWHQVRGLPVIRNWAPRRAISAQGHPESEALERGPSGPPSTTGRHSALNQSLAGADLHLDG